MASSSLPHTKSDSNQSSHSSKGTATPQNSAQSLPPNGRHPFFTLPAELILSIIDLLPPESFINFAFANYPLLNSHGLAPALSGSRVAHLTEQTRIPALFPLLRLPPEITLYVLSKLPPIDVMRFVLANYQDLARQGIAPPLTPATVQQLRSAVRLDERAEG